MRSPSTPFPCPSLDFSPLTPEKFLALRAVSPGSPSASLDLNDIYRGQIAMKVMLRKLQSVPLPWAAWEGSLWFGALTLYIDVREAWQG